MLNIIEGANFVGKTTTLDELRKKKKSAIFVYHPRFNDSEYYEFEYNKKNYVGQVIPIIMPVHRDTVYQISHMVCLKYLETFKEKNIIMDRIFISEMVYNEYVYKKIYETFIDNLKSKFEYKIYFLTCDKDEELKRRIEARLKADLDKKGYGVRVGDLSDPHTVEEKFKTQKILTQRYIDIFDKYQLNYVKIDTSDIPQKEVAKIISESMA
jgi:thymidylate kinase